MKVMKTAAMMAALACGSVTAASDEASKVVAFNASVRVEVDATGKPVKVEAPADLPEAVRTYIEKRVATWQYQPATVGGVQQAATTYVAVNACAVPVGTGYRMGLDFDGNGPQRANDQPFAPPNYPIAAEITRTEAEFILILNVLEDGRVGIDKFERSEITGRGGRAELRQEVERWVKRIRFDPEILAGKPVRGQVRVPVSFVLLEKAERQALIDGLQDKAKASRECQIASGNDDIKPVAMAPAVTVIPTPAS